LIQDLKSNSIDLEKNKEENDYTKISTTDEKDKTESEKLNVDEIIE
jgi:hypothetical protein